MAAFMDVISTKILPNLPAKSLARFKCVCKSFKALISSSEFINPHLQTSLTSINNRLLIYQFKNSCNEFYCTNLDTNDTSTTLLPLPSYYIPNRRKSEFHLIGCCNGLLLFRISVIMHAPYKDYYLLFLLNPSTGMGTDRIPYKFSGDSYDLLYKVYYGFGFDSRYDDYKIVQIMNYKIKGRDDYDYDYYESRREVKVYSMRSNRWRLVEDKQPGIGYNYGNDFGVLIDNYLVHWLIHHKYQIACFSLRDEVWTTDIPLLDDHYNMSSDMSIGVLDRCLCLLTNRDSVDIWIMKEYGVKESWTKLVALSEYHVSRPLQIGRIKNVESFNDEILVREDFESKLPIYEVKNTTNDNEYVLQSFKQSNLNAYVCFGSLVPLPEGKQMFKKKVSTYQSYLHTCTNFRANYNIK